MAFVQLLSSIAIFITLICLLLGDVAAFNPVHIKKQGSSTALFGAFNKRNKQVRLEP